MPIALGLWHRAKAQSSGSIEQYFYVLSDRSVVVAPIASYQFNNGLYFEGRYNYEEMKSCSAYIGKTFTNEASFKYSISPIVGGVWGAYRGGSIGANIDLEYGNFYLSSQPQYTLGFKTRENNFIYSWSEVGYQVKDWLAIGASVQHTQLYQTKSSFEKGLLLSLSYKNWSLPLYIFNPESKDNKYFLIGVNFEWEGKKKKKIQEKPAIPFSSDTSVNVLAALKKKDIDITADKNSPKQANVVPASGSEKGPLGNGFKIASEDDDALLALVLGPFEKKVDAQVVHAKLVEIYGPQAILYQDSKTFKIRVMGFMGRKDLESYASKPSLKGSHIVYAVMPYQIKEVEVYNIK